MRGLIAGAVGGMASAVGEIADGQIKTNRHMDLASQLSQIELEKQLRIDEVKRNRDILDIGRKSEAEAQAFTTKVNTPGFLESTSALAAAGESPSARTNAAIAAGRHGIEQEVHRLRRELAQATDETERARLIRQINDLSGADGEAGVRETLAQQVAAARAILGDMDASDYEKSNARSFLSRVTSDAMARRGGGAFDRTPSSGPVDGPWNKYR